MSASTSPTHASSSLRETEKTGVLVGLYGIPGCGKSYLLNQLKQKLGNEKYNFYEGSEVIGNLMDGGIEEFKRLEEAHKNRIRKHAITKVKEECLKTGRVGVITGHFSFWEDSSREEPERVVTPADLKTYTHVIYLQKSSALMVSQRANDKERSRSLHHAQHYDLWQKSETDALSGLCVEHGILFTVLVGRESLAEKATKLLEDFRRHNPLVNVENAIKTLDLRIKNHTFTQGNGLKAALVFDGDKTLIAEDTGHMFWDRIRQNKLSCGGCDFPLERLFSKMGYTYRAFRQATLLYAEVNECTRGLFQAICNLVARTVKMHPEFKALLQEAAKKPDVACVVITSGVGEIWRQIVENEGLSESVKVVGGGRISDAFVVDPGVKARLVEHLQTVYKAHVTAFGDSPIDLEILIAADTAIVVVGDEATRSKTMDDRLDEAVGDGLQARQALVPSTSYPRLDTGRLPLINLKDPHVITAILNQTLIELLPHSSNMDYMLDQLPFTLLDANERTSAHLLATPTRNAEVSGPALRSAHAAIGQYLATEFVSSIIGLELYDMPHVQGNRTEGFRLRHESVTTIVPILRGGEPMAFGVAEAFPSAIFVHAHTAADLKEHHIKGQKNIILVDSVVNSGKTVVEFVERLDELGAEAEHVVFVAGVVQVGAVGKDGPIANMVNEGRGAARQLSVVTLRLSTNKFTGKGQTDTGNRLFNTTHLD